MAMAMSARAAETSGSVKAAASSEPERMVMQRMAKYPRDGEKGCLLEVFGQLLVQIKSLPAVSGKMVNVLRRNLLVPFEILYRAFMLFGGGAAPGGGGVGGGAGA